MSRSRVPRYKFGNRFVTMAEANRRRWCVDQRVPCKKCGRTIHCGKGVSSAKDYRNIIIPEATCEDCTGTGRSLLA